MAYKSDEERKVYQREWYRKNREKRIKQIMDYHKREAKKVAEYKLEQGCAACGYKKCAEALDFHHVDGSEKESCINEMVQNKCSFKKILAEIAKCVVLCATCHREVTYGHRVLG